MSRSRRPARGARRYCHCRNCEDPRFATFKTRRQMPAEDVGDPPCFGSTFEDWDDPWPGPDATPLIVTIADVVGR